MDLILNKKSLPADPFKLFEDWYAEYSATQPKEPSAMIVATASKEGKPSVRTVLLKSYDKNGFVFFTNYESHKGQNLEENKWMQSLFYWDSLARQIRILGKVEKISSAESDDYFLTREYLSQIGAWASAQSKKIQDREFLVKQFEFFKKKYPEGHVPRPPHWGGFRIAPVSFEFWVGRENRLHDRFLYEKNSEAWTISRLAP